MKRTRGHGRSQTVTIAIFVLAIGLLLFSSIGGARAALNYYSEVYQSMIQTQDIGVTLVENGREISNRDYKYNRETAMADGTWDESAGTLLSEMLGEGESLKLGNQYEEKLSVRNSGTIPQYVRVSVYRYWLDKDGKKLQELSPELIDLNFNKSGWLLDEDASTKERTVLYYSSQLEPGGESSPFVDGLTIDAKVANTVTQKVEQQGSYKNITTVYDYDGVQFVVDVKADAIQNHNIEDAAWSEWGRRVSVNNGTLRLE